MFDSMLAAGAAPPAHGSSWVARSAISGRPVEVPGWVAHASAAARGVTPVGLHDGAPVGLTIALLAAMAPAAETMAVLAGIKATRLGGYDRVTALRLWEQHVSWAHAQQQDVIVAVGDAVGDAAAAAAVGAAGPRGSHDDDLARAEIAAALRLSDTTAGSRLQTARELRGRLAATGAALASGRLTYWHARSLVDAVAALDGPTAATVERIVLGGGTPDETLGRFRRRLARAVIAAAPATADELHRAEVADRRVQVDPQPHGMAWLNAFLTAAEAMAIMAAVNADVDARRAAGDDRPVDVLRADALVSALTDPPDGEPAQSDPPHEFDCPQHRADAATGPGAASAGETCGVPAAATECTCTNRAERRRTHPPRRCRRPEGQVTIDLPTLLGLADNPAELAGYGPIPPGLGRQLLMDSDFRRLVTEPLTGQLLDYGRTRYRPPKPLAEYVEARDLTCRFPGCNQPARGCDLDHACAYGDQASPDGGTTCPGNIGPLCRRHHQLKTRGYWQLDSHPDGTARWTSLLGHHYQRRPPDLQPEHSQHNRREHDRQRAAEAGDDP
ncbi:MAG TPA: DUF222 domain-containing protein [Mycobacteriales bacterium]|nr:DUF222 domain-containing protein [Mycobacteriales bacterium]